MFSRGQNGGPRARWQVTGHRAAMVVLVVLCASPPVQAQTTAVLQGRVVDESGAVIPAAVIRVRDDSIGFAVSAVTDLEGHYHIARDSRRPVQRQCGGVRISDGGHRGAGRRRRPHAGARLSPGASANNARRSWCARKCRSSIVRRPPSATSSRRQTVQQMPLNGRHFTDLGLLVPGSVAPSQTGFSSRPIRGIGTLAFNTAGNREEAVAFLVNGVSTNNLTFGSLDLRAAAREHPGIQGGQLGVRRRARTRVRRDRQLVTRSGTDQFHGDVFEFFRNDALDARNFFEFTTPDPHPFQRNQFGGSLGGPIRRGRTFFFAAYEGFRQRQGVDLNSVVLERRAARGGDRSGRFGS